MQPMQFCVSAPEPCGVLPYISLGETEGVQTLSVPPADDDVSEAIQMEFPIGFSIETQIQVYVDQVQST